MNNRDYTWFFIFMTLFNTNLGMSNNEKNKVQEEQNKEIINKLDKILEKLNE